MLSLIIITLHFKTKLKHSNQNLWIMKNRSHWFHHVTLVIIILCMPKVCSCRHLRCLYRKMHDPILNKIPLNNTSFTKFKKSRSCLGHSYIWKMTYYSKPIYLRFFQSLWSYGLLRWRQQYTYQLYNEFIFIELV